MKKENKRKIRPPGKAAGRAGPSRKGKGGGGKKKSTSSGSLAKMTGAVKDRMRTVRWGKVLAENIPYLIVFYLVEKEAWLYRHCTGESMVKKLTNVFLYFTLPFEKPLPSFYWWDMMVGVIGAAAFKAFIAYRRKNAKKYRQGEEYGSARWGNEKDIAPFVDPVFENNVILTQTEFLTMNSRPKNWKYARNKNVIVIGGSGSGKTRYYVKPNLMQMPEKVSYVVTDPKGTIIVECGKMLVNAGYQLKVLNTINFSKSMHYNPFHYIRSEKDILKLVNTIIANTKGDGEKSSEGGAPALLCADRLHLLRSAGGGAEFLHPAGVSECFRSKGG